MTSVQSFSHLGICVADLEQSTRFYVDVLGFTELFTMEYGAELAATMEIAGRFQSRMLARPDLRVELLHWLEPHATGARERRPMNAYGVTHLCVRVDDLDAVYAAAEQHGGAAHRGTLTVLPGAGMDGADLQTVYLTDPDGVRVECITGMPDLAVVATAMGVA